MLPFAVMTAKRTPTWTSSTVCTMNMSCRSSIAPSIQLLKGADLLANSKNNWSMVSRSFSVLWEDYMRHKWCHFKPRPPPESIFELVLTIHHLHITSPVLMPDLRVHYTPMASVTSPPVGDDRQKTDLCSCRSDTLLGLSPGPWNMRSSGMSNMDQRKWLSGPPASDFYWQDFHTNFTLSPPSPSQFTILSGSGSLEGIQMFLCCVCCSVLNDV